MEPNLELRYAQVVQIRERNRVVKVEKRMIFFEIIKRLT